MHRLYDAFRGTTKAFRRTNGKTILEKRGSPTKGDFIMTDINQLLRIDLQTILMCLVKQWIRWMLFRNC